MLFHSGEKPHKCPEYDNASSHAGHLRYHIRTHSLQKPNQRKWCDFSSITKSDLIKHVLTHSGEKSHQCNEGESSFLQAGYLKGHLRSTPEKNHTSAHNAVSQVLDPIISNNTRPNMTSPKILQQLRSLCFEKMTIMIFNIVCQ